LKKEIEEFNSSSNSWIGKIEEKRILDLRGLAPNSDVLSKNMSDELRGAIDSDPEPVGSVCELVGQMTDFLTKVEGRDMDEISEDFLKINRSSAEMTENFEKEIEEFNESREKGSTAGLDKQIQWKMAEVPHDWMTTDVEEYNCGTMLFFDLMHVEPGVPDLTRVFMMSLFKSNDFKGRIQTMNDLRGFQEMCDRVRQFSSNLMGEMNQISDAHLIQFANEEVSYQIRLGADKCDWIQSHMEEVKDQLDGITKSEMVKLTGNDFKKPDVKNFKKTCEGNKGKSLTQLFIESQELFSSKKKSKEYNINLLIRSLGAFTFPLKNIGAIQQISTLSDCEGGEIEDQDTFEEQVKVILTQMFNIDKNEANSRIEKIRDEFREMKIEHMLLYLESSQTDLTFLFEDCRDPIFYRNDDSEGHATFLIKKTGQLDLLISAYSFDEHCEALINKSFAGDRQPEARTQEEHETAKLDEDMKQFLKRELKILEDNNWSCFYFGYVGKAKVSGNEFQIDYGESSGQGDWTGDVSEFIKDMKDLKEGFAANDYEHSDFIPRMDDEELARILKSHHDKFQKGENSQMWNRKKGIFEKQKEANKVKKSVFNPIKYSTRLFDSECIILVNMETYLTIILFMAMSIQRFYSHVKVDFKALSLDDLNWDEKNMFGPSHRKEWNHIGAVFLMSLKTSRESGDIYQFPFYPRRNGLSMAGSSVTLSNYEPSLLFAVDDDKKTEIMLAFFKLYCQGDCPEKGVHILNQFILSKWDVRYHVLNRTHIAKNMFELIDIE